MKMEEMILKKDYKSVIKNFCELSAVPRGSGYNKKISNWLCGFAEEHGLWFRQDEALNVLIKKPATAGYENKPAVLLQGHMDMVCVKDENVNHDFCNEGLSLLTDGEYIFADGTTLGADDGISIAYMLSLLADQTTGHPELVCLITTDEETGMDGAKAVDLSDIKASYMINIDSDEESVCWCGCAGGMRMDVRLPVEWEERSGTRLSVDVSGLSGGHSGAEIHKYIPNAIKVMGRFLNELQDITDFGIVSFAGGEKDNSIPVNAKVEILLYDASGEILKKTDEIAGKLLAVYGRSQKGLCIRVEANGTDNLSVLTKDSCRDLLFMLQQSPDGVQCMSTEIKGLVETSVNLGIFELTKENAGFHFSLRSSVAEELKYLSKKVAALCEYCKGTYSIGSEYPAWEYKNESALRDLYCRTYSDLYNKELQTTVIHAGLECGLFSKKMPEADIISIGPDMHDIHTTKERLSIDSAIRLYKVLEKMLEMM